MAITLNPGFAILIGAALALILPWALRTPAMIAAAAGAMVLMFAPAFGEAPGFAQIGLEITPLRLDPLSQVFGLGLALATAILALFSGQRRDKLEDVALMAHAGGAVTAIFAGDLVSFVAAAAFSALAGAVLTVTPGTSRARAAGLRYLIWHMIAGVLMTAGVGLIWSSGYDVRFERIGVETPGGLVFFLGLLISAGAPMAHVWVKDAAPEASTVGGAALALFTLKLAAYGLARGYGGEPSLLWIGAVMALGALAFAFASDDLRRSLTYGQISQTGIVLIALSIGAPLAAGGAAAYAFASVFSAVLAFLAMGVVRERMGTARASELGGLARTMPMTASLAIIAALAALAAPGFAGFTGYVLLSDAVAQGGRTWVWLIVTIASAGAVLHAGLYVPYAAFFGPDRGLRPEDAPFGEHLAMGLAAFFCLAVGLSPGWLYSLLPDQIFYHPYDWDHLIAQTELIAFAALAFAAMKLARLDRGRRAGEVLDVDWFYRRPAKAAVGWAGRVLLQIYEAWNAAATRGMRAAGGVAEKIAARADRPAAPEVMGAGWILVVLTVLLVLLYLFQR